MNTHGVSARILPFASGDPLPPATLHILMSLAEGDRHGYAVIQDVEPRTDGELKLSAGTLFRSIQRMRKLAALRN